MDIQRFFLLSVGLLFCIMGCTREPASVIMPDDVSSLMETMSVDTKTSFEQNLLPILTANCALAGCHVENGPHGLDFRTYESFIAGGEHGPVYIPGNAEESEIIEEIVEGKMPPPPRDPLSAAEIQLFVDWINQQEAQEGGVHHDHEDDMDDDDDHVDEDDHDGMDDGHDHDDHDDMRDHDDDRDDDNDDHDNDDD